MKLIEIFAGRVTGCTVELAKFYNQFGNLLSSRSKEKCFDYYDKAVDIYEKLDMIGDELSEVYFNIGVSFVEVVPNSGCEWRSIFDDDGKLEKALDSMKYFFDKSIEIKSDKNGYKSLEVANQYIEIARIMVHKFHEVDMELEKPQLKEYFSYFEKCLIESFEIKREILGLEDKQTKDICYELYQFYMADSMDIVLNQDIIKDNKKALYYGELYLGE